VSINSEIFDLIFPRKKGMEPALPHAYGRSTFFSVFIGFYRDSIVCPEAMGGNFSVDLRTT
jgi:hypothetical protein